MFGRQHIHDSAQTADPELVEPVEIVEEPVIEDAETVEPEDAAALHPVGPEEHVDGVPVLAELTAIEPAPPSSLATRQAAAAAATGFVAGAATLAIVYRLGSRRAAPARAPRRAIDMLPIVGSRSFLVDVHLIAKPGE
jgi:hypothetical protein